MADAIPAKSIPRWARYADFLTVALVAVAGWVFAGGGLRTVILDVRVSLTSGRRVLAAAAIVLVVRHLLVRRPSLLTRLMSAAASVVRDSAAHPLANDDDARGRGGATRPAGSRLIGEAAVVIVLMIVLTVIMTYPQIRWLDGMRDLGDSVFATWRLAWIAHQLPRDWSRLFDANIFSPERRTLAYSDAMLLPNLAAVPLVWLGMPPVVADNLLLLSSFVLSGAAMYLLVRSMAGRPAAAIASAVIFAFYPYRYAQYFHIEELFSFWIPLAAWALHRTLARGRLRDGALMGAAVAGQFWSCLYLGMFLLVSLVPIGIVLAVGWRRVRATMAPILAGAALAAVLVAPLAVPYLQAQRTLGDRSLDEIASFSATPQRYLVPHASSVLYGKLLPGVHTNEQDLFPGFLVLLLAGLALWPPLSVSRVAYLAVLLLAFEASLGVHGYTYPLLLKWVAPFRGMRVPARFAMVVGFSLAVLAGHGVARLIAERRTWTCWALAGLLSVAVLAESRCRLQFEPLWPVSRVVYGWLAAQPPAVVAELPPAFDDPEWFESRYLYFSTFHWQSLLNGYSGFFPQSYRTFVEEMRRFPTARSVAYLRDRRVDFVVIHEEFYRRRGAYGGIVAALEERRDLLELKRDVVNGQEIRLYRVIR